MISEQLKPLTAGQIADNLRCRISRMGVFTMQNVYLLNSPWECDVIKVLKSGYWHEYEIKLSASDFRNDFQKTAKYGNAGPKKHDLFKSPNELNYQQIYGVGYPNYVIPKPATFTFVTPAGLLKPEQIPAHCGLLELDNSDRRIRWSQVVKSPRLKKPTKLSWGQLFNLCLKRGGN